VVENKILTSLVVRLAQTGCVHYVAALACWSRRSANPDRTNLRQESRTGVPHRTPSIFLSETTQALISLVNKVACGAFKGSHPLHTAVILQVMKSNFTTSGQATCSSATPPALRGAFRCAQGSGWSNSQRVACDWPRLSCDRRIARCRKAASSTETDERRAREDSAATGFASRLILANGGGGIACPLGCGRDQTSQLLRGTTPPLGCGQLG